MLPVFQDLNQLKAIYSDRWETFTANAGVTMSFRANDLTTAEWLSKRMGETSRLMETENESESESGGSNSGASSGSSSGVSDSTSRGSSSGSSAGWSKSKSFNISQVKVPYMPPQELFGLREGELVVFASGKENTLHLYADAYYEIESRDLRKRKNPYFEYVPPRPILPQWDAGDRER